MSAHHLTYFKVDNFKRFDSLELTDIGQFNLIVGDNNVGKTSLLEALSVLNNDERFGKDVFIFKSNLAFTLLRRRLNFEKDSGQFFRYLSKDPEQAIGFQYEMDATKYAVSFVQKDWDSLAVHHYINDKLENEGNIVFKIDNNLTFNKSIVPANISVDENLPETFTQALGGSIAQKEEMIQYLKVIDNNIRYLEIQTPVKPEQHVMIGLEGQDKFMPISSLGESAVRVFYYLLNILRNKGGRLMIDEIDTGIHHTRMKPFLKNIIQLAVKHEVQLFFTTHSGEFQQAFVEVFEAPDMVAHQDKVRQYSLLNVKNNEVYVSTRNFSQLENSLEIGFETRGGKSRW